MICILNTINWRTVIPRLSLYRPERKNDYYFIDRVIEEQFTVGGTDLFIHKYIGTDDGEVVKDHRQIQDMLFLENRDRKYDADIYKIRGVYTVQDLDFDLSQFGIMLSNDVLFLNVHINASVRILGRKIMSGDVIELPHLKDEYAENDYSVALKRFYVVEEVARASEGFSQLWLPHLYRVKIKQLVDDQIYQDIFNTPLDEDLFEGEYDSSKTYQQGQVVRYKGNLFSAQEITSGIVPSDTSVWSPYSDNTLRDLMSSYNTEMQISQAVEAEAEENTPKSGYDVKHYYTLAVDERGNASITSVDDQGNVITNTPTNLGYDGFLLGDEFAPNGSAFSSGISFPVDAQEGNYYLRIDLLPNRLFRYDGSRWTKVYDMQRTSMSNQNDKTLRGSFINNVNEFTYTDLVASDAVRISEGNNTIDTKIKYIEAKYLELVYNLPEQDSKIVTHYIIDDYADMITVYEQDSEEYIKVTLPSPVDISGLYIINLYNHREQQRQSLSELLKPKADN